MISMESLRCLCTVIETAHFHRAAALLHKTQPAVTQQIKRLERELGHVLIDRNDNRPTPAGKMLYAQGKKLLQYEASLRAEIRDFDETDIQALRVGTSDTNALYYLPPHIHAFSEAFPNVGLIVECRSSELVAGAVAAGEFDLGIVTLPLDREELATERLYEQRMVLVVRNDHALARQKSVALNRLSGEAFVLLGERTNTGTLLRRFFAENNFVPNVTVTTGSFEVVKRYVEQGIGISVIPEMVITPRERDLFSTLTLRGVPKIGIGAVWRKGSYQTRAAKTFLRIMQESRTGPA